MKNKPKTYRDELGKAIKGHEGDEFAICLKVFAAYRKAKKIDRLPGDAFNEGGAYQQFLDDAANSKVISRGLAAFRSSQMQLRKADRLIKQGERLIRIGYRIADDNSYIAKSDIVGERARTHVVSLVGIHDKKGGKSNG